MGRYKMNKKRISLYFLLAILISINIFIVVKYSSDSYNSNESYGKTIGNYYYKADRESIPEKNTYVLKWTLGISEKEVKDNIIQNLDLDRLYSDNQIEEREKVLINMPRLDEYANNISNTILIKNNLLLNNTILSIIIIIMLNRKTDYTSYKDGYINGILIVFFFSLMWQGISLSTSLQLGLSKIVDSYSIIIK